MEYCCIIPNTFELNLKRNINLLDGIKYPEDVNSIEARIWFIKKNYKIQITTI